MNYESIEDRVERLENQVSRLINVIGAMNEYIITGREMTMKGFAAAADQGIGLAKANLASLKLVIENSSGFAEPFRSAILAVIAEQQKKADAAPSLIAEVEKLLKPAFVLPDDLFGSGKQPPHNPPAS